MLSKEEIESKLEQTEDDEITINLLYQEVDLLKSELEQLETNNKKLIKKLEGDIKILGNYEERKQMSKEQLFENDAKWFYAAEILEIAKGEKE